MVPHARELEPLLGALASAGCRPKGLTLGRLDCHCFEHDYKNRFVLRPSPRHDADPALLDEFRLAARHVGGESRVIFGTIASGDEDVIDPARARDLQAETGAVCVAWEGAGAARAARFSGFRFLELRAITDGADHAAAADFQANLARSMPNLGHLLLSWSLGRVRP
jgi:adenosylhomocysteine nucleosidase